MSARTWRNGPPPHVGWWNARVVTWRPDSHPGERWGWWDGVGWSAFALERDTAGAAADIGSRRGARYSDTERIEWSDYYPEGARVPRVAP